MGETTGKITPVQVTTGAALPSGVEREATGTDEAAQIRSGIDETRSNLSATIDALQDKLDPTNIAEQVKDQIRDKAADAYDTAKTAIKEATIGKVGKIMSGVTETVSSITGQAGTAVSDTSSSVVKAVSDTGSSVVRTVSDTSSSVVQYIRQNPIPFSLLGLGLGMLAISKNRKAAELTNSTLANGTSKVRDVASTTASSVADMARSAADRTTTVVSSAKGTVREFATTAADSTRQQLYGVSNQAQQGAKAATNRFKSTLQENPMVLGAAAIAVGALVGLSLPSTQVETEYMGEARDRLVDQAKSLAQETADKVKHVAEEAGHTAQETAKKEGLVGG